jgi:hypothetical protein
MNRDYSTGKADDAVFFTGVEVEHTPAFGMKTLFVTGVQDIGEIEEQFVNHKCEHIFFGANHSLDAHDYDTWEAWENMIEHFLEQDILCTLDIALAQSEQFLDGPLVESDNFIPQIRVPLPYIKQFNYNTTLKLDDKDFKATNPGVWCHNLHDLMDRSKFTPWADYGNDEIVK